MLIKWPNTFLNGHIALLGLILTIGLVFPVQADNRLKGISTRSFVQNNALNYIVRKTLSFSKKLSNHIGAI